MPRVVRVGPGRSLPTPSAAARAVGAGDTVEIEAGIYEDDVATWVQDNLVIRGVGGRAHLATSGIPASGMGIWVLRGHNTTIENIEFSGARAATRNGAGICLDGVGLTVRNCYLHHNENGILGGGGTVGDVVVEYSEFEANGHGGGQSHNIYIGNVRSFTLRGSYVHHAKIGHNVKSRALTNYILYNRIMDEATGTSCYAVDLPNGGIGYLIGNLIQQGPFTENPILVAYGAEGLTNPVNEFYMVNNTVVNDWPKRGIRGVVKAICAVLTAVLTAESCAEARISLARGIRILNRGTFIRIWGSPSTTRIINNLLIGVGTPVKGDGELSHNLLTNQPGSLIDRDNFNFRLKHGSSAIDGGTDPGIARGFSLAPTAQYVHPAREEPRRVVGRIDIGAYEYTL